MDLQNQLGPQIALFGQLLEGSPYRNSGNDYNLKIEEMCIASRNRLIINVNDIVELQELRQMDTNHFQRLLQNPTDYITAFERALKDEIIGRRQNGALPASVDLLEEYFVGFEGSFGSNRVSPRELTTALLRCLVNVEGIVTKISLVKPKLILSVHYSDGRLGNKQERFLVRSHRDSTSTSGLPTAPVIPTRDEDGNLLIPEWGLSKFKDCQTITVQEMPERAPPGQLPRSVEMVVENDLVDLVKPGDRVSAVGVFRALPSTNNPGRGVFKTTLLANSIQLVSKEVQGPRVSAEDIEEIKKMAQDPRAFDILSQSLAPSIYGHKFIKKAILLQMLGGNEKNIESSGLHLRGDISIHNRLSIPPSRNPICFSITILLPRKDILMVGDPGTAKSQLLRFVLYVAPLAVSTSGRGSTGVGLTAAVVHDQETGDRRLEAGAMVLADRGVVCIDEFDKMSEEDRVAIHEVMEQQTVTVSKAGIHASLNARCSVLAAANPIYGKYDASQPATKNISMPDSLLSRFDLLFIVLDRMDPTHDRSIAEHVLRMHRYHNDNSDSVSQLLDSLNDLGTGQLRAAVFQPYDQLLHGPDRNKLICTIPFLKKYIMYAKKMVQPVLSEEARQKVIDAFDDLRKRQDNSRTLPVTARQLETMIRLTIAHAKCRLSKDASESDAEAALKIMRFALYNENHGSDEEPGTGDGTAGEIDGGLHGDEDQLRGRKRKADEISFHDDDAPSSDSNSVEKKRKIDLRNTVGRVVLSLVRAANGEPVKVASVLAAVESQELFSSKQKHIAALVMEELQTLSSSNRILLDNDDIYGV